MVSLLKSARAVGLAALMMLAAVMGGALVTHALPSPGQDDIPTRLDPAAVSRLQAAPTVPQPATTPGAAAQASAPLDEYARAPTEGEP
jgi:hypothetical protein